MSPRAPAGSASPAVGLQVPGFVWGRQGSELRSWCLCGNYSTLLLVAILFAVPRGVLTFHLVVNGWFMVSEHSHVLFSPPAGEMMS